MGHPLRLFLLMLAGVLFIVATLPMATPYWNRLVSAGLAAWVASQFVL